MTAGAVGHSNWGIGPTLSNSKFGPSHNKPGTPTDISTIEKEHEDTRLEHSCHSSFGYIYMYLCMYIHIFMYIYTYVYIYICIYNIMCVCFIVNKFSSAKFMPKIDR